MSDYSYKVISISCALNVVLKVCSAAGDIQEDSVDCCSAASLSLLKRILSRNCETFYTYTSLKSEDTFKIKVLKYLDS